MLQKPGWALPGLMGHLGSYADLTLSYHGQGDKVMFQTLQISRVWLFQVCFRMSSLKWVLISILIWSGFMKCQNRENYDYYWQQSTSKTMLNWVCLQNGFILVTCWQATYTMPMFVTWYFCFPCKGTALYPCFPEHIGAMCFFFFLVDKWYKS